MVLGIPVSNCMFYVVGIIFGGKHIPYMYIEDKKKFIAEMHSNTLIGTIDERKPANGCSGASATHC